MGIVRSDRVHFNVDTIGRYKLFINVTALTSYRRIWLFGIFTSIVRSGLWETGAKTWKIINKCNLTRRKIFDFYLPQFCVKLFVRLVRLLARPFLNLYVHFSATKQSQIHSGWLLTDGSTFAVDLRSYRLSSRISNFDQTSRLRGGSTCLLKMIITL